MPAPSSDSCSSPQRLWLVPVLACTLAACIVLTALHHPMFVDDPYQMAYASSFASWKSWWGADVFGYFRPVKNMLAHAVVWSTNPAVAHSINLIFFVGAAAVMSHVARRVFAFSPASAMATFAWMLSPLLVSSAVWYSSANIMAMAFFLLLGLWLHDRSAGKVCPSLGGAGIFFALALLSYEHAIVWPALAFLWDTRRGVPLKKRLPAFTLYALIAALYLLARWKVGNSFQIRPILISQMPNARLSFLSAWFFLYHLAWWIVPFGRQQLLVTFVWGESAAPWMIAAAWPLLLGYIALTVWAWRNYPWIGLGLAWYAIASLPTNNFLPFRNGPLADYYLVLPSIGLAIALGAWMAHGLQSQRDSRRLLILSLAWAWIVACGITSLRWANRWNHPLDFFRASIAAHPAPFASQIALAELTLKAGDADTAMALAREGIRHAPQNANAYSCLADIHFARKEYKAALEAADQALEWNAEHIVALATRGRALQELGELDAAQDAYRALLQRPWGLNSEAIACHWAILLLRHDLPDEALRVIHFARQRSQGSHKLLWYEAAIQRIRGEEAASREAFRQYEALVVRRFPGYVPTGTPPDDFDILQIEDSARDHSPAAPADQ